MPNLIVVKCIIPYARDRSFFVNSIPKLQLHVTATADGRRVITETAHLVKADELYGSLALSAWPEKQHQERTARALSTALYTAPLQHRFDRWLLPIWSPSSFVFCSQQSLSKECLLIISIRVHTLRCWKQNRQWPPRVDNTCYTTSNRASQPFSPFWAVTSDESPASGIESLGPPMASWRTSLTTVAN